jgi:type IV pilus assembly protein PilE
MVVKRIRGFTLLEVMIVCVIVGILAAIVLPSYQNQLRKQRRGTAQSLLMDIASKQQTYLLDSRAYAGTVASCDTAGLTTLHVTVPQGVSDYYTVCVQQTGTAPPTFIAKASATGGQVLDLGTGVDLSIDDTGNKLPLGKW